MAWEAPSEHSVRVGAHTTDEEHGDKVDDAGPTEGSQHRPADVPAHSTSTDVCDCADTLGCAVGTRTNAEEHDDEAGGSDPTGSLPSRFADMPAYSPSIRVCDCANVAGCALG